MNNILNKSTWLPRLTKSQFLSILAVTALILTATFSHADSDRNRPAQNHLEGTWISNFEPGVSGAALASYMSDGRVIWSIPVTLLTGGQFQLASTGHGEWMRTGHHEFVSTMFFLNSDTSVEFTHLVKLTSTIKLNDTSDQSTVNATVSVFNPDGTLLVSFPFTQIFKRVVAGQ